MFKSALIVWLFGFGRFGVLFDGRHHLFSQRPHHYVFGFQIVLATSEGEGPDAAVLIIVLRFHVSIYQRCEYPNVVAW